MTSRSLGDTDNPVANKLIQNVLYEAIPIKELVEKFSIDETSLRNSLKKSLKLLYDWRNEHRPRPHLDDKVVLGWNGLMVSLIFTYCEVHCIS